MLKQILISAVVVLSIVGCSGGDQPAPAATTPAPAATTPAPDASGTPMMEKTPMEGESPAAEGTPAPAETPMEK